MTATHQNLIGNNEKSITIEYAADTKKEIVFAKVRIPAPLGPIKKSGKKPNPSLAEWSTMTKGNQLLMTQAQLEDFRKSNLVIISNLHLLLL